MEQYLDNLDDYFYGFRRDLEDSAEAGKEFQLYSFLEIMTNKLMEVGLIEGFEACCFRSQKGIRVDGYWFDDEEGLCLFIADYDSRYDLMSLTKTDVKNAFKRVTKFFIESKERDLYETLEETTPEYGLARQIRERRRAIHKVKFFLLSERALSDRVDVLENNSEISEITATHDIIDISRLYRLESSGKNKEVLDIDLLEEFKTGLPCLPTHLNSSTHKYKSYLVVTPAKILASLYGKHGARLLEQNVRCFLQARGNVNKGMRNTILKEPEMFFSYNNGITATAQNIETKETKRGLELIKIKDLQIVNGGQTTASLFHTNKKDDASLDEISVQMKLSIIDKEKSETLVPLISQYANTQNKVNAADFSSNHPFHVRMEDFSRRIWAPVSHGALRETKWFYERARGQYADAQSKLTPKEKKKFIARHPRNQMFTKTDLAKFDNVWDENPAYVNLGAQKNFVQYARRIGKEWKKSPDNFNESYFKRVIARAILFRKTEKLVSVQPWYNGGYRANVVAYTLALLGAYCRNNGKIMDFMKIWNDQTISNDIEELLKDTARLVHEDIIRPSKGISNVTEWCKRESCWVRLENKLSELEKFIPKQFKEGLLDK